MANTKFEFTVSARTVLKILGLTAVFLVLLAAARITFREIVWIGIAFFFALALNPAVEWVAIWLPRRSRIGAVTLVYVTIVAAVVLMGITLTPPLVRQSEQLVANFPSFTTELTNGNSPLSRQIRSWGLAGQVRTSQAELAHYAAGAGGSVFTIVGGVFTSFAAGITILGLAFFMLIEGPTWLGLVWKIVPDRHEERTRRLAGEMYKAVTGYVSGNLLTSLMAAVLVAAMLTLVHVPYAIPLGILVGLFDLLPLVGATIGSVVVLAAALFTSVTAAVVMLVFFLIYQQLENHLVQPIIYGRTVRMSPLSVLVWVLLGAGLGGIVGALVAIPIGASVQILLRDQAAERERRVRSRKRSADANPAAA